MGCIQSPHLKNKIVTRIPIYTSVFPTYQDLLLLFLLVQIFLIPFYFDFDFILGVNINAHKQFAF